MLRWFSGLRDLSSTGSLFGAVVSVVELIRSVTGSLLEVRGSLLGVLEALGLMQNSWIFMGSVTRSCRYAFM